MLKQERQKQILQLLQEHTYLSIVELSDSLNVSDMTIRRDVLELSNQGRLIKLYGGAQKLEIKEKELSTVEKSQTNIHQKKYIGKRMNQLINDNEVIFVAAGTTIFYALSEIKKKNLTIVTNSLIAFSYLKEQTDYRILLTGGEFYPTTEEFLGDIAIRAFDNLNIDIAFGSTNGIFKQNVTTARFDEGIVQNAAFEKSKKTCIVADSSKLGTSDIYTFTALEKHDYLITDSDISKKVLKYYEKYVQVMN